jgi:tRNA threonylcarbamoyladenosine biosynthesis protein TsaE
MVVITRSAVDTERLGECLGRVLEPGDVVTLTGDLGAGKTRFAQGVASGLDVDRSLPVTSPTFTILNEYQGRCPFYHFDFYRFRPGEELRDLGFEEYFAGTGVCLVEWPERLGDDLDAESLEVVFVVRDELTREIIFSPHGTIPSRRVASFREVVKKCFDRHPNSCY